MILLLSLSLVLSACAGPMPAQVPVAAEPIPRNEIQADPDAFAESTKLLTDASTKEARRDAFKAVLECAREVKQDPRPLVDVLKNKQPQATFVELLLYLKDNETERHKAFLPTLIVIAYDTGDSAASAKELVLAYKADDAIDALIGLLKGKDSRSGVAAATLCREHIGGLGGLARMVEPLVGAMESDDTELKAAAHRSLKNITKQNFDADAALWRNWLKGKSTDQLKEDIFAGWMKAKKDRDKEFETLQQELLKVLIDRMRKDDRKDAARLIEHLSKSPYVPVREEAATLIGELLAAAKDAELEAAKTMVAALGVQLLQVENVESLRIACARALAVRPVLSFETVARCLDVNGNSPALKLELVRALKTPVATARLAILLTEEIDRVETASNLLLRELITQAQSIVSNESDATARHDVLAQFSRLLEKVEAKLKQELPAPELARYNELAKDACKGLAFFARIQQINVADCVPALMAIAASRDGAAASAITAVREALSVATSREIIFTMLTTEPLSTRQRGLYDRYTNENNEAMLVLVIGLYEALGVAPDDLVASLTARLVEFAKASADTLGDATRQTLRGAIRALLARIHKTVEERKALVDSLMDAAFGDNDVIAYFRLAPNSRIDALVASLQPRIASAPGRVADIVRALTLSAEESATEACKKFSGELQDSLRTEYEKRIERGLKGGEAETAEALKADLTKFADAERKLFVEAAVKELLANAAASANRDVVTTLLVERLKAAHPGKYEQAKLEGEAEAFKAALQAIVPQLKQDGYKA
ncbi:MAG: hypothetical protein IT462_02090 [Planctomycetes bacterium]|nr:hypothetical protein [Planctomycetota bacterium]